MWKFVCCMSTDPDIEVFKERFCKWWLLSGLRSFRSDCIVICCESNRSSFWGERGIRTLGSFPTFSFQDWRNRPLCHLSNEVFTCQRGWWSFTVNPKRSLNLPTAVSSSRFKPLGILASPMKALSLCTRDFSDNLTRYQGCSLPIDL